MMETIEGARRSTRAALAEIPLTARLGQLRVSPPRAETAPLTAIDLNAAAVPAAADGNAAGMPETPRNAFIAIHLDNTPAGLSSAMLSPTPSPDELVIQQRGRRRMPVTWSPDIDYRKRSPFQANARTPPKMTVPSRNGIVLRSTPRKRLLMNDPEKTDEATTPQRGKVASPAKSPAAKKLRTDRKIPYDGEVPLGSLLRGMTREQLIEVIESAVGRRPELERELRDDLPAPDVKALESQLAHLKKNILRSLPSSRLTSKTDSPAFSRAAPHVVAFKKCLVDQGRVLTETRHWPSVMEYALGAWNHVKAVPLWDSHSHNSARRQCFKFLVGMCSTALKRGEFDDVALEDIRQRLRLMVTESDDVEVCLRSIDRRTDDRD